MIRLAIAASLAWSSSAAAARPVLAGEQTFGVPGGVVVVHYATTGPDAPPMLDANGDDVPDFVAEVAATGEHALAQFGARGFARPLPDDALGGDDRVDLYLRDLEAADGNAGIDHCTGDRCVGHAIVENDFAGFGYPSIGEGIRSVVPHELFHLVQAAYATGLPAQWSEGTAVWAVEQLYGADNADFERFLPAFLARTYRPFERASGGFGDAYPYGAALWPAFLEHRYGVAVLADAWQACATQPFLAAIDSVLATRGTSLDQAWLEFTRWNAFTGRRATRGGYPAAEAWSEVPREPALSASGTIHVEGLSARYVPLLLATRSQVAVADNATGWLVGEHAALVDGGPPGIALPGAYLLVVTGLARDTIATPVEIVISEPAEPIPDTGCAATSGTSEVPLLWVSWLAWRRRYAAGQGTLR